ncbi:MAG: tRNA glutamyl-Q(34) synthetase GluQRS [Woeseiaceae bacterium]
MIGTIATGNCYIGRFAPSPTGPLHLGSLIAAVISYLDARYHDGQWLVRMEDIDPPREIKGAATQILHTLERHGLQWDGNVRFQRHSAELHTAALRQLHQQTQTYFCDCARKKLIAAGLQSHYPGICRDKALESGAIRVRTAMEPVGVEDRWQARLSTNLNESPGDFIVRRRDQLVAYQLAVVVDDADQGVTDIVRGVDLYTSTPRQVWLQHLLGLETPRYAHFPVLLGTDGTKLSKQTGAKGLDDERPAQNLVEAFAHIGLEPDADASARTASDWLAWAQQQYQPNRIPLVSQLSDEP